VVSQRDIFPDIRRCMRGLPTDAERRIWIRFMSKLDHASVIDIQYEERSRRDMTIQLALTAIASTSAEAPGHGPSRVPYETAMGNLRALSAKALESSSSLKGV